MTNKLPYREGTWFAVPLRNGGYGTGVVSRQSGQGVVFGYFFGPRRETIPSIIEVSRLRPFESILKIKFGDLGLLNKEWPIIGQLAEFNRSDWPLPPFIRVDDDSLKAWKEIYTDQLGLVSEEPCDPHLAVEYPKSVLAGYGAVEKRLTRLMEGGSASHS